MSKQLTKGQNKRKKPHNVNNHNNQAINNGNCHNCSNRPPDGNCLASSFLYEVTARTTSNSKTSIWMTKTTVKFRYICQSSSFWHTKNKYSSKLSEYIWKLKGKNKDYTISCWVVKQFHSYLNSSRTCSFCLLEKIHILECLKPT